MNTIPNTLGAMVMSGLVVIMFATMLVILMLVPLSLNSTGEKAFFIMLGVVGTAFGQAVNYWLGSSAGSANKANTLAEIAKQP